MKNVRLLSLLFICRSRFAFVSEDDEKKSSGMGRHARGLREEELLLGGVKNVFPAQKKQSNYTAQSLSSFELFCHIHLQITVLRKEGTIGHLTFYKNNFY